MSNQENSRSDNTNEIYICPKCDYQTKYKHRIKSHFVNKKGCPNKNNIVLTNEIKKKEINKFINQQNNISKNNQALTSTPNNTTRSPNIIPQTTSSTLSTSSIPSTSSCNEKSKGNKQIINNITNTYNNITNNFNVIQLVLNPVDIIPYSHDINDVLKKLSPIEKLSIFQKFLYEDYPETKFSSIKQIDFFDKLRFQTKSLEEYYVNYNRNKETLPFKEITLKDIFILLFKIITCNHDCNIFDFKQLFGISVLFSENSGLLYTYHDGLWISKTLEDFFKEFVSIFGNHILNILEMTILRTLTLYKLTNNDYIDDVRQSLRRYCRLLVYLGMTPYSIECSDDFIMSSYLDDYSLIMYEGKYNLSNIVMKEYIYQKSNITQEEIDNVRHDIKIRIHDIAKQNSMYLDQSIASLMKFDQKFNTHMIKMKNIIQQYKEEKQNDLNNFILQNKNDKEKQNVEDEILEKEDGELYKNLEIQIKNLRGNQVETILKDQKNQLEKITKQSHQDIDQKMNSSEHKEKIDHEIKQLKSEVQDKLKLNEDNITQLILTLQQEKENRKRRNETTSKLREKTFYLQKQRFYNNFKSIVKVFDVYAEYNLDFTDNNIVLKDNTFNKERPFFNLQEKYEIPSMKIRHN